jgi:hypothetical protein
MLQVLKLQVRVLQAEIERDFQGWKHLSWKVY